LELTSEPFIGARLEAKCCTLMNLGKKAVVPKDNGFLNMFEKIERIAQAPLNKGFRI
jgi:3-methyladenine DNA glycosylase/8-oxoguanine DNA glycosylase